jgi:hypothetical protein
MLPAIMTSLSNWLMLAMPPALLAPIPWDEPGY